MTKPEITRRKMRSFRLTDHEDRAVRRSASAGNLTVSDYLRLMVLGSRGNGAGDVERTRRKAV